MYYLILMMKLTRFLLDFLTTYNYYIYFDTNSITIKKSKGIHENRIPINSPVL